MIRPDPMTKSGPDRSVAIPEYFLIMTHTKWKRTDLSNPNFKIGFVGL